MRRGKYVIAILLTLTLCACSNKGSIESTEQQVQEQEFCEVVYTASKEELFTKERIELPSKDNEKNVLSDPSIIDFYDTIYYISYSTEDYWVYSIYDSKKNTVEVQCKLSSSNDVFSEYVYNGKFLLGIGTWEGSTSCKYRMLEINQGEEKEIFSCVSNGYPTSSLVEDSLVINISEHNGGDTYTSRVFLVDLLSGKQSTLEETEYEKDDQNYYKGTIVGNNGGWKTGFVYQKVTFENENIEEDKSGKSVLYYYDINTKEKKKLFETTCKSFYLNGNDDVIITSDYLLTTIGETGTLYRKIEDGYEVIHIPNVEAGSDIMGSSLLEDGVMVHNYNYFYYFDFSTKTYVELKLEEMPGVNQLDYRGKGSTFVHTTIEDDKSVIYRYTK